MMNIDSIEKEKDELDQIKKEFANSLECNLIVIQLQILGLQFEDDEIIKIPKEMAKRIIYLLDEYQKLL